MAKRAKKPKNPTPADDLKLVVDFVRRLRRVALHPLALDDSFGQPPFPGDLLRKLMQVGFEVSMVGDEPQTMTTLLPDEVSFESLATRVRTFTLERDRLYFKTALAALDRLTGLKDIALRLSSRDLLEEWKEATGRDNRVRAYFVVTEDGTKQTDVDLAYAWLYQDLAHGDEVSTGQLGVQQRFEASVGVFSHIAVVAIETLHYINHLCELGVIELPVGTFSDRVISYKGGGVMQVTSLAEVDLDEDLDEMFTLDGPMPKSAKPMSQIAPRRGPFPQVTAILTPLPLDGVRKGREILCAKKERHHGEDQDFFGNLLS